MIRCINTSVAAYLLYRTYLKLPEASRNELEVQNPVTPKLFNFLDACLEAEAATPITLGVPFDVVAGQVQNKTFMQGQAAAVVSFLTDILKDSYLFKEVFSNGVAFQREMFPHVAEDGDVTEVQEVNLN